MSEMDTTKLPDDSDVEARSPAENALLQSAAAARARRKFDLIVVPLVTMFYFLSFLDRSNIGNARTSGLQKDLKMTNHQYSVALTITYVPYILTELPSNLLLKRLRPNLVLPALVIAWGIVSTLQGVVTSYHGLLAARFFLGFCEGGLLPGIMLYLSSFYERHQLQVRVAVLFTATSLAGAFSGLLAYAISHMDGVGGKAGWSWIFILEGLFTVAFGIFSLFVMPQTPGTASFLTHEERFATLEMLRANQNGEGDVEPFSWREVWSVTKSPQAMLMLPGFFANGVTLFGLAYFAPSIVNSLGYSTVRAQLFTVPPYACAFVVSMTLAFVSDRWRARGLVSITSAIIALAGYAMFYGSKHKHVRYGSLFLQVTGAYISAPTISTWQANNLMPHYRRATGIAFAFIFTNAGGICSTWIFTGPPLYRKATVLNMIFCIILILSNVAVMAYVAFANAQKRRERVQADSGLGGGAIDGGESLSDVDILERKRLGDRHRDFDYSF